MHRHRSFPYSSFLLLSSILVISSIYSLHGDIHLDDSKRERIPLEIQDRGSNASYPAYKDIELQIPTNDSYIKASISEYFSQVFSFDVHSLGINFGSPRITSGKQADGLVPRQKYLGIVVNNCGSRLDMIHELPSCFGIDIIIFEKCGLRFKTPSHLRECTTITRELDGTVKGFNMATFMHYISTRYDSLHNFTIFLKNTAPTKNYFLDDRGRNLGLTPLITRLMGMNNPSFASLSNAGGCGIRARNSLIRGCYLFPVWAKSLSLFYGLDMKELERVTRWCSQAQIQSSGCFSEEMGSEITMLHACAMEKQICAFVDHFAEGICLKGWMTCNCDNYGASASAIRRNSQEFYQSLYAALVSSSQMHSNLLVLILEYTMNIVFGCPDSHVDNTNSKKFNISCFHTA